MDRIGRTALGALLVYASLAILLTADAWASPSTHWIGSCCDPEQTMWFLRWMPYAIEHAANPLVTTQINAPLGANLMWNSSIPFIALLLTPLTLTAGPIAAYNVAIVASIALSGWCCFIALRRFSTNPVGPLVGGAVYAFSPYVISHTALHLNLVAVWAPPLFLLLLSYILDDSGRSPRLLGAAVGLLAAAQLVVSEEILATSAVSGVILIGVIGVVAIHRRVDVNPGVRRLRRAVVAAVGTFLIAASAPLAVQFLGPQRVQGRLQDVQTFSTDLLNLVVPTKYQLISPHAATTLSDHFTGLFHEATAYLGFPLLIVLTAIIVWSWQDLRIRTAGSMALLMAVLSLGPVLHVGSESTGWPMPWGLVSQLPLLENALPGRLTLYMWLAVAAILSLGVDRLLKLPPRYAAPGLLVLGIAVLLAAPGPMASSTTEIPQFFERWGQQGVRDDSVVLLAPYFTDGAGADPMLWAAEAGDAVRMYEAYAYVPGPDGKPSYGPPGTQLSRIMETIQDQGVAVVARGQVRQALAREIAAGGITDVIVGPMRNRRPMVGFFSDLFGRLPAEAEGVERWSLVDRLGVPPAAD